MPMQSNPQYPYRRSPTRIIIINFYILSTMISKCLQPLMFLILMALVVSRMVMAGDPDILSDFIVPVNNNFTDPNFFVYTGLRGILPKKPLSFNVTKATMAEFPALNGQSVSFAILRFPASSVNPPHTHPRASELLFLIEGTSLEVGFVDTTNKLYTQTLKLGDIFVFPKGLVHYQFNSDPNQVAVAVSAFGSANAGTVSVPKTIFATGIDDTILAKAFKTDVGTIEKIKAGLSA